MKDLNDIPVVFSDKFPVDFINNIYGWNFSQKYLNHNRGKLLTLDIDVGNCCSLNCPHCFRRKNKVDVGGGKLMNNYDVVKLIVGAKKLGLRSIKILGAGEPFEDSNFLPFLIEMDKMGITVLVFTKGHVLGDDVLAKKYYSQYGITNSKQLVDRLAELDVSILLGFNSSNPEIQDQMVGDINGYTPKRNMALKFLVEAGFNSKINNPTKLCLAMNPITYQNYDQLFEMYKWARTRNIYPIVCPTMVSGRCGDESWRLITPSAKQLIDLYAKIYKWNIKVGIQTIEQIREEGIASYAGAHPCNQVACGMYVTLNGTILRCPGDDTTVLGSIFQDPLENIWKNSENYGRSGTFNCGCPPKWGKSIPYNLFTEVMNNLEREV